MAGGEFFVKFIINEKDSRATTAFDMKPGEQSNIKKKNKTLKMFYYGVMLFVQLIVNLELSGSCILYLFYFFINNDLLSNKKWKQN